MLCSVNGEQNSLTTRLCFVSPELVPPPPSITIQAMERNVTLVGKRLCWSDALFYCRDFNWDLLSIRGLEDQEMVDELVASAPFPLTSHLWVGLRRYWQVLGVYQTNKTVLMIICPSIHSLLSCQKNLKYSLAMINSFHPAISFNSFNVGRSITGSSWFWMSRDPMDFTQWDAASHHSSPCGGVSSVERSTWRQSSCEEHLDFICVTGWCPACRTSTRSLSSETSLKGSNDVIFTVCHFIRASLHSLSSCLLSLPLPESPAQ